MIKERVLRDIDRIRGVSGWEEAQVSGTYDMILIPRINLPKKYNIDHTQLLIVIDSTSDYTAPKAYVDRGLQLRIGSSHHIDEDLTEAEMLKAGWVSLCIKIENWTASNDVIQFLQIVLRFLRNLQPDTS